MRVGLVPALLAIALLAALALGAALSFEVRRAARLSAELDSAERSIAALQESARLSAAAAQVAAAARQRETAIADEYRALRDTLTGESNAPLPAWFADYLRRFGVDVVQP